MYKYLYEYIQNKLVVVKEYVMSKLWNGTNRGSFLEDQCTSAPVHCLGAVPIPPSYSFSRETLETTLDHPLG
jgi:hypothetical protein